MNTSISMSAVRNDTSEKLSIIDRKTFENIQQYQSVTKTETFRKVHNAKFRKKNAVKGGSAAVFNLMQFLTKTSKQTKKEKTHRKYTVCLYADKSIKKRGKTREGGKRKKPSKLKKSILRYRSQKRQPQQDECGIAHKNAELLKETVDRMSTLSLDFKDEKKESFKINDSQGIIKTFHSRRFRSYCDNCTTPLLAEFTEKLLRELDRFQKRALMQNAIKAHAHRRFVVGFREAQSFLLIKKVKLIIIAPDCEACTGEDGLDVKINNIKDECRKQNIPYLFSLRRRQLAYALFKKSPVGCIAVLDFDGARELFSKLMDELQKARKSYEELSINYRVNQGMKECKQE